MVIEDLGYLDSQRMQRRQAQGVGTIVPLRATLALYDLQGRRINLLTWLRRHPGQQVEREVEWQGRRRRLVALPAAPATAARKRVGMREAAQRHGRAPNLTALALADWIVALTTVSARQASVQQIATLLRLRWQIELVFKLWKDQGKLDETRGWNAARIETELCAKLLGLLIEHWLLLQTGWQWADRSLVKAGQSIRAYARSLCLLWTDHRALAELCDLLARSLAVAGRVTSHCHQRSAAVHAQSA